LRRRLAVEESPLARQAITDAIRALTVSLH
jgi:hypothetical protein